MLQEIAPFQFNNHYRKAAPSNGDTAVIIRENTVLLKKKGSSYVFPLFRESSLDGFETVYLFSVDERRFFFVCTQGSNLFLSKSDGFQYFDVYALRTQAPKWVSFAAAIACQLAHWYQANRYCGRCGSLLQMDQTERRMCCRNCNNAVYPKICPAVIVAVIHEDKIIMTKYAGANGAHYALIAGFAEIGETIEETVQREVMEEVGVRVKNIRYYKSQPWPFSDTLLFGFFCELDGKDKITMDKKELSYAAWVDRREMKTEDDTISLTYEMMAQFRKKGAALLKTE